MRSDLAFSVMRPNPVEVEQKRRQLGRVEGSRLPKTALYVGLSQTSVEIPSDGGLEHGKDYSEVCP
jgi:hypothetical protein